MGMTFKNEYKKQCYEAFKYSPFVNNIMESLESGASNYFANLRTYMDAAIDDLQNEINQCIGQGEEPIHNARVTQLTLMFAAWQELFNIIDNYITNKNNLNASWYKNTDYKAQITLNELISLNELMKKTEEAKNLSQQLIKDELKTTISNLREKQNAIDSSFIETNINKKI